jgi:AcrR family transcriptional regulator
VVYTIGLMPRQRFFNLPVAARDKLLELALEEFAERGFDEASLNEILARAGISKGAYYYYFDDKEDLFAAAIDRVVESMLSRLPLPAFEKLNRQTFWPTVESSLGSWLEMFDSLKTLFRVLPYVTAARRNSPRFAPVIARSHTLWRTIIEAGQRVGCVRTDIPNDLLVRIVEANDQVLDMELIASCDKLTRKALEKHMRLVFDTFKRLLVIEGPDSWASSPVSKRTSGRHG